ncbi:unnamed protein product [Paramecium sonneborni]|uniref:Uncharacterized protein n=1 Tax=Paramecium sonneborni TaxID=65129 RepID=A0A8S1RR76_9CILI|nr:unnamed protein product [Paramecium sonneborni]
MGIVQNVRQDAIPYQEILQLLEMNKLIIIIHLCMMVTIYQNINVRINLIHLYLENVFNFFKDIRILMENVIKQWTTIKDRYLSHYDQSDDANNVPYDGCYLCEFSCNYDFQTCNFGECSYVNLVINQINLKIYVKVYVDIELLHMMNDVMILIYYNIKNVQIVNQYVKNTVLIVKMVNALTCDDGNDIEDNGCIDCYYQYQEQWTHCENGEYRECNIEGWQLDIYKCTTICGNEMMEIQLLMKDAMSLVQNLDNQNNLCFIFVEMVFIIHPHVNVRMLIKHHIQGIIIVNFNVNNFALSVKQELGWIIQNNQCTSYCGDGLVVGYEQSDNMNSIEKDGYDECKFICDQYCINYQEGILKNLQKECIYLIIFTSLNVEIDFILNYLSLVMVVIQIVKLKTLDLYIQFLSTEFLFYLLSKILSFKQKLLMTQSYLNQINFFSQNFTLQQFQQKIKYIYHNKLLALMKELLFHYSSISLLTGQSDIFLNLWINYNIYHMLNIVELFKKNPHFLFLQQILIYVMIHKYSIFTQSVQQLLLYQHQNNNIYLNEKQVPQR